MFLLERTFQCLSSEWKSSRKFAWANGINIKFTQLLKTKFSSNMQRKLSMRIYPCSLRLTARWTTSSLPGQDYSEIIILLNNNSNDTYTHTRTHTHTQKKLQSEHRLLSNLVGFALNHPWAHHAFRFSLLYTTDCLLDFEACIPHFFFWVSLGYSTFLVHLASCVK